MTGNLVNAKIAVDSLSIWYVVLFISYNRYAIFFLLLFVFFVGKLLYFFYKEIDVVFYC